MKDNLFALMDKMLTPEEAVLAKVQFIDYQLQHNTFNKTNTAMWQAARSMPGYKWWFGFAKGARELRKFAVKVLAVATSGSSLERTWSTFEFIHSKRRNCLTISRANALVTIFSNMQLRRRVEREAARGEQDPAIPWRLFDEEPEFEAEVDEFEAGLPFEVLDA